jgi:hypothetical protein
MGMLDRVTTGKIKKPELVLIYGPDGVGKSTFAANAPSPIFAEVEEGTANLDVARMPLIESWGHIIQGIKELLEKEHPYKSLVIDSLDWLESLLWREICREYKTSSIELACGGFGKGYVEAVVRWDDLIRRLSELRNIKGMNIILIGHSETAKHNDAINQVEYDKFQLKLNKRAAPRFREWVDAVLFANFEVHATKDGENTRAFSTGVRKLWTEGRPGFDAKNRLGLPPVIDLSWQAYIDGKTSDNAECCQNRIEDLLKAQEFDEAFKTLVRNTVEKAKGYLPQLLQIEDKLKARLQVGIQQ